MRKLNDLTGQQFGRWTVIGRGQTLVYGPQSHHTQWNCRCRCGQERAVAMNSLVTGKSVSCGCYKRDMAGTHALRHGMSKTRTHRIWALMKGRCLNSTNPQYPYYGGRGISVCRRWRDSFDSFVEDMGECPPGLTIERINNNSGYCKENCRWASVKDQARNKRNNKLFTWRNRTMCLAEWAEWAGLSYSCLLYRVSGGVPFETAISSPSGKLHKRER